MANSIDRITIKGFKSIRSLEDFELRDLNILIGANGAGKSNFVSFFAFLREMVKGRLAYIVNKYGGADTFLFQGLKTTKKMAANLSFNSVGYSFELEPSTDNRLFFSIERVQAQNSNEAGASEEHILGNGQNESMLMSPGLEVFARLTAIMVRNTLINLHIYQFNDTDKFSAIRRASTIRNAQILNSDGSNLAAFLLLLRDNSPGSYKRILDAIRFVAPFFRDFRFVPTESNGDSVVLLEWLQKNNDYVFHPSQFSDGTLRYIALATALLQPDPPTTMLIDEPELGLHPYALSALSRLIQQARKRTQLIISTQSVTLVNEFDPADIVVVDRKNAESTFQRLDERILTTWLEDYTLGQLWQKNIFSGGPQYE